MCSQQQLKSRPQSEDPLHLATFSAGLSPLPYLPYENAYKSLKAKSVNQQKEPRDDEH